MRGRILVALIFALASMTAWAGAIPFAQSAPVAIAYNAPEPEIAASPTPSAPEQSSAGVASTNNRPRPAGSQPRFDALSVLGAEPTDHPADPPPVQLSTAAPQEDPTDAPEPTPTSNPTAVPEPTDKPEPTDQPDPTASPTPKPTVSPRPDPTASPTPSSTPRPTASPAPSPTNPPQASYTGPSHFWYPALGIDTSWSWYGCDYGGDSAGLGAGIYRWGCGPANNIYLLSHAWSTFKKIKTAYHSGALQVGQNVWYANAQGDVTKWEVAWIRHVTDEYLDATAGEWALNDSPTPIMTLQTCDGSQDQFRIIVRLVPAH